MTAVRGVLAGLLLLPWPLLGQEGADASLGLPVAEAPAPAPVFQRPEHVRGIYVNAWAAGSERRMEKLIRVARRTEINSFVIDLKDASGYVSWDVDLPVAREIGATEEIRIRDLPGLLRRLHREGIYPIARIVMIKDPLLAAARSDLAIQDTAGAVWTDRKGQVWTNPYHPDVWAYHVELARKAAELGFPEIQWDYVRFPDAPASDLESAYFPGAEGRVRAAAIREFLSYARKELKPLGVQVTADVFGVTTTYRMDPGIGQVWEELVDVVDVVLPMVYPSHYGTGNFGLEHPNAHPYEVVHEALSDAVDRSAEVEGAGSVRPWIQDFTLGDPPYGPFEVRAQIQAAYDVGIREWILWNPSSRYTLDALAPEGGFPEGWDPYIRVAGGLHPASRAREVVEEARAAREAAEVAADSAAAAPEPEPADTVGEAGGSPGLRR